MNDVTKKSFETINKSTRIVEKNLKRLYYLQKSDKNNLSPSGKKTNK
jgi:hypothetical protein